MVAVFPVVSGSGFDTTPSYSGSFIPEIWSTRLNVKFYEKTILNEISNTNWEGEIRSSGDTVHIRTAPSITIKDYVGAGMSLVGEVPTPVTTELQINLGKYFKVDVDDVLATQTDVDLMSQFKEEATTGMKIAIEDGTFFDWFVTSGAHAKNKGVSAGAKSAGYNLGSDTAPVSQADPENLLNTVLALSATLDEQNVPDTDRWLLMSAFDRSLLMMSDVAKANFMGDDSSVVRSGKIGMLDRFTIYQSNLLPRAAAGKAWVSGQTATSTGSSVTNAKNRRMIVAGHKSACTFASQITKVETMRNPEKFGDFVRGLNVFGRKVIKPEALATAIIGQTS